MKTFRPNWVAAAAVAAVVPWVVSCKRTTQSILPSPKIETRTYKRDLPGCGDKTKREEPCLTFFASWVEVKTGASPEVLAGINRSIEAQMHPEAEAPQGIEQESESLIASYQKLKAEYPEMPQTWFDRRTVDVLLNDGKLLSVSADRKYFKGGPYAVESTRLLTFRMSDGKPVSLEETLKPEELTHFNRLADKRLRMDRGIDPAAPLDELAIRPGENGFSQCQEIAAMPKGLRLHFEPGVIAYQAAGAIDITLSWEEVAPTLKTGGPFAHLAGR